MDRISRTGESFESCCVPWLGEITNYAERLCQNVAQAQDLAQQTMLSAWQAWPRWRTGGVDPKIAARAWLICIAHNKFLNGTRSEAHTRSLLVGRRLDIIDVMHQPTSQDAPPTPHDTADGGTSGLYGVTELAEQLGIEVETSEEVLQALALVRKPWRDFIRRRYFVGQSYEEIAAETGYGMSTISSGISRGLARMRPLLEGYARTTYGLGRARIHPALQATEVVKPEAHRIDGVVGPDDAPTLVM